MCEVRIRTIQLSLWINLDEIPNTYTLRHGYPYFAVVCNFIWPTPYLAKIGDVPLKSYGESQMIRAS